MFKRVLIANRGEIARRIARTCRAMGIEYVTVYSDADADAPHHEGAADQRHIGGSAATTSYLDIESIVDAAVQAGCDAVHPGYGFLSESPAFATAVTEAGLVFVGPDAATIAAMGDKATARTVLAEAGVPVLPGSARATESLARLAEDCRTIGYPVILKPVAGGGGKGMRVVHGESELLDAVGEAVRLGRANFGDGRLLAERYLVRPRHIEVQVFGDGHGNVVHLYERECSLQRRHQKVVEEAPAVRLPSDVRAALLDAAVRGARALRYVGAGTFEFVLDGAGEFYFLEVNTRLQVEHPVTEEITGLDLVEWQLRVAAGERLPLVQQEITTTGHAIECRVYAEDPAAGFRPAPGRALTVAWPDGVRVEAAFDESGLVTGFYDPMIAKLVAHGPDRAGALRRLCAAVREATIVGLTTNLGFLGELLAEPRVIAGRLDTHLVDEFVACPPPHDRTRIAAACAAAMSAPIADQHVVARPGSPWLNGTTAADRVALDPDAPLGRVLLRHDSTEHEVRLTGRSPTTVRADVGDSRLAVKVTRTGELFGGTVGDTRWAGRRTGASFEITLGGHRVVLAEQTFTGTDAGSADDAVRIAIPGTVVKVARAVGDTVAEGDLLLVVEAMKMENRVLAPRAGVIEEIRCAVQEVVAAQQVLVTLAAASTNS
jgi:acetyl-CoA/propionyl-CoA carboxylase biotin carboxyl carrier protein